MAPRTVASIRAGAKSVIPLFFQQYSKNNGRAWLTAGGAFGGGATAFGAVAFGGEGATAGGFTTATSFPMRFNFRMRIFLFM